MECEKFKKKYSINASCCISCHEDDETGFGNDLWFTVEDKDWNICCNLVNTYYDEPRPTQEANKISKQ